MTSDGQDHLSKAEISKDALQSGAQAAAATVGEVATIITGAVKDVAGALGGLATELFEIRDSARRAAADQERDEPAGPAAPTLHPDPDAVLPTQSDVHPDPDAPGA